MSNKNTILCFNSLSVSLTVTDERKGIPFREYYRSVPYAGVNKNFFLTPSEIEGVLTGLLKGYSSISNKKIQKCILLLPQHFFKFKPCLNRKNIQGKVSENDLADLKNMSKEVSEGCFTLSTVYGGCRCNGVGNLFDNILGMDADFVEMLSVTVGVYNNVKELFNNISKNLHIDFIYSPPCIPVLYNLNKRGITRGLAVLMSELTSDVFFFENNFPVAVLNITTGYKHFSTILKRKFEIDDDVVSKLIREINFGISFSSPDYVVFHNNEKFSFNVKETNNLLLPFVESYAKEVYSSVKGIVEDEILPLYILGSDIASIHGFCENISVKTNLDAYTLCPDFSGWNHPEDFVMASLIDKLYSK